MFAVIKSRSGSKLGHLGQKLGHQVKKENIVNTLGHIFQAIIMNLAQNVCLDDF